MSVSLPKIIFLTGADGSGKTFFADCLRSDLSEKGYRTVVVWSRFNNYLSKPILLFMRITGHSYYRTIEGTRFGYHDFQTLGFLRGVFAVLQAIDVNIASYLRLIRAKDSYDLLICERGPWDTLVDVMADTGLKGLAENRLGRMYTRLVERGSLTLLIRRDRKHILESRPELVNDTKLTDRIDLYEKLARIHGWPVIENNGSVSDSKKQISDILGVGLF